MAREIIDDRNAENVAGGSIVFNSDHTTCGLNCNNQCTVNDYDAVIDYISEHHTTMKEADMMRNMCSLGYITRL